VNKLANNGSRTPAAITGVFSARSIPYMLFRSSKWLYNISLPQ